MVYTCSLNLNALPASLRRLQEEEGGGGGADNLDRLLCVLPATSYYCKRCIASRIEIAQPPASATWAGKNVAALP